MTASCRPALGIAIKKRGSQECQSGPLPVRAKVPAHAPNGLGDDRDGKQFQSMDEALRGAAFSIAQAIGRKDHQERRRQGEPCPGGEAATKAAMHQTQSKSRLRTRRPRHKLGEHHDVGIGLVGEPLAAVDELASEIAKMGDGAAEACAAQPQKRQEDRERVCHLRSQRLIRTAIRHDAFAHARPRGKNYLYCYLSQLQNSSGALDLPF